MWCKRDRTHSLNASPCKCISIFGDQALWIVIFLILLKLWYALCNRVLLIGAQQRCHIVSFCCIVFCRRKQEIVVSWFANALIAVQNMFRNCSAVELSMFNLITKQAFISFNACYFIIIFLKVLSIKAIQFLRAHLTSPHNYHSTKINFQFVGLCKRTIVNGTVRGEFSRSQGKPLPPCMPHTCLAILK